MTKGEFLAAIAPFLEGENNDMKLKVNVIATVADNVKIDQTDPDVSNVVYIRDTPQSDSDFAIIPYSSPALEALKVIKNTAGNLFKLIFTNTNGATRYFQLFDSASIPIDGTVPMVTIPVAAGAKYEFEVGKYPIHFASGITVCNSTTLATKTVGAADSLFFASFK